jgi:hypothetical protein
VQAVAEVMRAELDTAFCNFLNEAIEQEEARLRALGLEPVPEPKPYFASLKDDGRAAGGEEDDESGQNGPGQWPGTSAALEAAAQAVALRKQQQPEGGGGGAVGGIEAQQWLLVLRTVKRGVYALLAKDRDDDIKQVRQGADGGTGEGPARQARAGGRCSMREGSWGWGMEERMLARPVTLRRDQRVRGGSHVTACVPCPRVVHVAPLPSHVRHQRT